MKPFPAQFDGQTIRRVYDEATQTWWFSVVDIVQVLTQQPDYQTARRYWNQLKLRLSREGSQSVTDCHRLKLPAADGKHYLTDTATAQTLLRLVQQVGRVLTRHILHIFMPPFYGGSKIKPDTNSVAQSGCRQCCSTTRRSVVNKRHCMGLFWSHYKRKGSQTIHYLSSLQSQSM